MKKKKEEIMKQKLKEPKDFKKQIEMVKNFRPKNIVEKQDKYVWSISS